MYLNFLESCLLGGKDGDENGIWIVPSLWNRVEGCYSTNIAEWAALQCLCCFGALVIDR
jgi:hypothetical protein